jgi:hypothetical protein
LVHGLDKFREYFQDYSSQYVLIGGTACDILMNEIGAPFRATKDFDIVLIIENLDSTFVKAFWKFIEDGGYKHREKEADKNQFYRFLEPSNPSFPKMIELFSKHVENLELICDLGLTPIHIDQCIVSLSAILLNDAYYDLLKNKKRVVDGISIIEIETAILFKIKAWLDMKERKEVGENIDSKDIKKHKNDIFRLLANVIPASRVEISAEIQNDVSQFIECIAEDKPDLRSLGVKGTSFEDYMEILKNVFSIE